MSKGAREQQSVPAKSIEASLKEYLTFRDVSTLVFILFLGGLGVAGEAQLLEESEQAPAETVPDLHEPGSLLPDVHDLDTQPDQPIHYVRYDN